MQYSRKQQPAALLALLKSLKSAETEPEPPPLDRLVLPTSEIKRLWHDFETRGVPDLSKVGADNYFHHPATIPLMLAYAFDDGPVQVVDLTLSPMPECLLDAVRNPNTQLVAWNSAFERQAWKHFLHIDLSHERFFDPSSLAKYLTYPGRLGECSKVLDLGTEGKDDAGKKLIDTFSRVSKNTKTKIKKGEPPTYYKDRYSHPEQWEAFIRYCVQDTAAMRTITRFLESIVTLPESERQIWLCDQTINNTGIPLDSQFIKNADRLMDAEDARVNDLIISLTGLANPNSDSAIKRWLAEQQYPMASIAVAKVDEAFEDTLMPALVREVMTLRAKMSGAGPKKLKAALNNASADGRLREMHVFYGASATGRFSGRSVQPQNLPKPEPELASRVDEITECIRAGYVPADVDPVSAITSTIRSSFRPLEPDHLLAISDYSMIEVRVIAWLSNCTTMQRIFAAGEDIYKHFACVMFGKAYEDITSQERDWAKIPVLALSYSMGWKRFQVQAKAANLDLSDEEAQRIVRLYKDTYPEIPAFWKDCNGAFMMALERHERIELGNKLVFDGSDRRFVSIKLPSKRSLYYRESKIVLANREDWGIVPMIVYRTQHQYEVPEDGKPGKKLIKRKAGVPKGYTDTYGGKLCENLCQAVARDVLCDGMTKALDGGLKVVTHVHDELVVDVQHDAAEQTKTTLEQIMSTPPAWAPGLTVGASAYLSPFYRKEPKKAKPVSDTSEQNSEKNNLKNSSSDIDRAA